MWQHLFSFFYSSNIRNNDLSTFAPQESSAYLRPELSTTGKKTRKRNHGKCQFCGFFPSEEAHHGAFLSYPLDEDLTDDDLIGLCSLCHHMATMLRRCLKALDNPFKAFSFFRAILINSFETCTTQLLSGESIPECCNTPSRSVSTNPTPGRLRKLSSPKKGEPTEAPKMKRIFKDLNVSPLFGGKKSTQKSIFLASIPSRSGLASKPPQEKPNKGHSSEEV